MPFKHVVVGSSPTSGDQHCPVGQMDKAPAYGAGDSGFDSQAGFHGIVSEWLRRRPAKELCFARAGSNPADVVIKNKVAYSSRLTP